MGSRLVGLSTPSATSSDICKGQCQRKRSTWFTILRILLTRSGSALPFGPPPRTAPESPTECEARRVGHQLVSHTVAAANQARQRSSMHKVHVCRSPVLGGVALIGRETDRCRLSNFLNSRVLNRTTVVHIDDRSPC